MFQENVTLIAAFGAGVISFVSPCVLPIVPGYLSFISGATFEELVSRSRAEVLRKVIINTLFFILGFTLVFVLLGATASSLGQFISAKRNWFNWIAGAIIIVFGLHLLGVFRIKWLNYEKRFQAQTKPVGIFGSFVVGLAFAFGWSPCIGPILSGILLLAANQATVSKGMILLGVYSLGIGIPFLITGIGFNYFLGFSKWLKKHFRTIEIVSGAFLIAMGVLIFTGSIGVLSRFLAKYFPWLNLG